MTIKTKQGKKMEIKDVSSFSDNDQSIQIKTLFGGFTGVYSASSP